MLDSVLIATIVTVSIWWFLIDLLMNQNQNFTSVNLTCNPCEHFCGHSWSIRVGQIGLMLVFNVLLNISICQGCWQVTVKFKIWSFQKKLMLCQVFPYCPGTIVRKLNCDGSNSGDLLRSWCLVCAKLVAFLLMPSPMSTRPCPSYVWESSCKMELYATKQNHVKYFPTSYYDIKEQIFW